MVQHDNRRLVRACITAQRRCLQTRTHRSRVTRIPVGRADASAIAEACTHLRDSGFTAKHLSAEAVLEVDFCPSPAQLQSHQQMEDVKAITSAAQPRVDAVRDQEKDEDAVEEEEEE